MKLFESDVDLLSKAIEVANSKLRLDMESGASIGIAKKDGRAGFNITIVGDIDSDPIFKELGVTKDGFSYNDDQRCVNPNAPDNELEFITFISEEELGYNWQDRLESFIMQEGFKSHLSPREIDELRSESTLKLAEAYVDAKAELTEAKKLIIDSIAEILFLDEPDVRTMVEYDEEKQLFELIVPTEKRNIAVQSLGITENVDRVNRQDLTDDTTQILIPADIVPSISTLAEAQEQAIQMTGQKIGKLQNELNDIHGVRERAFEVFGNRTPAQANGDHEVGTATPSEQQEQSAVR